MRNDWTAAGTDVGMVRGGVGSNDARVGVGLGRGVAVGAGVATGVGEDVGVATGVG